MENKKRRRLPGLFLLGVMAVCLFLLGRAYSDNRAQRDQQEELLLLKENSPKQLENAAKQVEITVGAVTGPDSQGGSEVRPVILEQYKEL